MTKLLTVDQLTVERQGFAVFAPVSFAVQRGQVVCLRGDNGAGKTTLLRALAGLIPLAEGAVHWHCGPNAYRYMGHALGLRAELSAAENLQFLLALDGEADADVGALLSDVGLRGYEDVATGKLSAGQRKRVSLARLVASRRARMWLLDEPYANLDAQGLSLVGQLIDQCSQAGIAVVHASHGLLGQQAGHTELRLHAARLN